MLTDSLPTPATPFIGRTDELAEIAALLTDPACRLLTLVGPGGIGKTRLALEAARRVTLSDGSYFVALQPLTSPDFMISAIADAVGFQFYSGSDPKQQLLDYLREKSLLLLLDNFEHLLDGAEWVSVMLAHAPDLKVLATSREALNLQEEWVYPTQGLPFPPTGVSEGVEAYTAVRLFMQSARRMRADFALADEQAGAIRICQLVEGMPLGIELAAARVRALSCAEIADEIEHSLDILATPTRNVEPRHRTMRAVLEHSWSLLTDTERAVFKRLSVFRGGFRKEAAQAVAGASLPTLSALVDKSLLRAHANGRCDLHELLRQYGAEQLTQSGDYESTRDAHSAYYVEFCDQREPDIKGCRQLEALDEIEADFENVRMAWIWAVEQRHRDAVDRALESLFLYCEMRTRWHEVDALFQQASVILAPGDGEEPHPVWGRILARRIGEGAGVVERGRERYAQALVIAQRFDNRAEIAYCLWRLGEHSTYVGNYSGALPFLEQSLMYYQDLGDRYYIGKVLNEIGIAYREIGQLGKALDFQQQSLTVRRAIRDDRGVGWSLFDMSVTLFSMGCYAQADRGLEEADDLWRKLDDRFAVGCASGVRAYLALLRGEFELARAFSEETLGIAGDIHDSRLKAIPLKVLGALASIEGNYLKGQQLCEQSLALDPVAHRLSPSIHWILAVAACGLENYPAAQQFLVGILGASETDSIDRRLGCLPVAAIILAHESQPARAVELLGLAFHYPDHATGWLEHWPLLTEVRANLETQLGAEAYRAAWERGTTCNLDESVAALLEQFQREESPRSTLAQAANRSLVEPLSERELEVLRLIAQGLTNPEIAEQLVVGVSTVKKHINHLYGKLGVQSRTQALIRARAWELV